MKHASSPAVLPTFCPPFSSAPPLVFVSLFPVGHKRRRRTSFPTAWAQAGVAHIHYAWCISLAVIFINIHTPLRNKLTSTRASLVHPTFLASAGRTCCSFASICSQNSLKSICVQGVGYASSLHLCAFIIPDAGLIHILFKAEFVLNSLKPKQEVDPANKDIPVSARYIDFFCRSQKCSFSAARPFPVQAHEGTSPSGPSVTWHNYTVWPPC